MGNDSEWPYDDYEPEYKYRPVKSEETDKKTYGEMCERCKCDCCGGDMVRAEQYVVDKANMVFAPAIVDRVWACLHCGRTAVIYKYKPEWFKQEVDWR
jgi:hypothetical protein